MLKSLEFKRASCKEASRQVSREKTMIQRQRGLIKFESSKTLHAANTKASSKNKLKNSNKNSKDSKKQLIDPICNIFSNDTQPIYNRKRLALSEDKLQIKHRPFKRKSGKHSSRSIRKDFKVREQNENEQTLIEKLKQENEYYKTAFLASRKSIDKLEKYLEEQKQRRSNQKTWFKHQMNKIKKQISLDKVKLSHIFSFQSYKKEEVSNMIIETDNEGSSLIIPANVAQQIEDALSRLSIESK